MTVLAQLFAATHQQALTRADALDAGREPAPAPHTDLPVISPVDLEVLGEIAARAVRFGTGDLETAEVDLDHELLFRLPEFLCEVLAAVGQDEDPDVPGEVAQAWSASEELGTPGQDLLPLLTSIVALVTQAQEAGLNVYLWVAED